MNAYAGGIRCNFQCRLPNGEEYCGGSGEKADSANETKTHGTALYAVPFDIAEEGPERFGMPSESTPRGIHSKGVEDISRRLREERASGKEAGKTVLARVIVRDIDTENPVGLYRRMCGDNPGAFVFYIDAREAGKWMGASPELLCRKRGERIETMALAGTRPAESGGDWDAKNREEQKIVERFIRGVLERYCDDVSQSEPYTKRAGYVEHICSDLSGTLRHEDEFPELLKELSPTPALCGYPRSEAMKEIHRLEMWPRGLYGGYLALDYGNGDADIYVNLRSMRIEGGKAAIYAGGGIMADSHPDSEWEETERKSLYLRNIQ